MIINKKILIIGGTGSLGNQLTKTLINNNQLFLYSRDESKHWKMFIDYNKHENLNFIIGDISNYDKISQTLVRHNFNIIIMAAALKHIDKCEFETNECINTNLVGTQHVLNAIELNRKLLPNLESVCFVSTDKACSPVNVYGMTKAISESLMVEKSKYITDIKFVSVRYGNVLNSRGSIIPLLHKIGTNNEYDNFTLTDGRMTRFVMTLEQSVDLILYALSYGESGDIIIPKLISCNIKDMIEIFSEFYGKKIVNSTIRPGEKMLESLINETQSMRLDIKDNGYMHIKPCYKKIVTTHEIKDYNSKINPLTKSQLKKYLEDLNLIDIKFNFNFNVNSSLYTNAKPFPHCYIDNILNEEFALKCQHEILNIEDKEWDRYENPFEGKYTLRDKNNIPHNCNRLFTYLTSIEFLNILSNTLGEKVYNDPTKNWWGIHKYNNGDHLDVHVDAGLHPVTKQKKYVTLGIYLSKDWKEENGGHLEIWDGDNVCDNNAKLNKCCLKILPIFNRLILFNCTDNAWHGNPDPVNIKDDEMRIFLTLSYVSEKYDENYKNTLQKAYFIKRPEDPVDPNKDKLRILRADPIKYKEIYNMKNNIL